MGAPVLSSDILFHFAGQQNELMINKSFPPLIVD